MRTRGAEIGESSTRGNAQSPPRRVPTLAAASRAKCITAVPGRPQLRPAVPPGRQLDMAACVRQVVFRQCGVVGADVVFPVCVCFVFAPMWAAWEEAVPEAVPVAQLIVVVPSAVVPSGQVPNRAMRCHPR